MERLWSPWRMEYIEAAKGEPGGCIFCDLPAKGDDAATLILARGVRGFVLMNSFPYNPGHLMVAPFRHTGDFEDLHGDELSDLDGLLKRSLRALREEMEPQGFNIGTNLGRVAGAGIPDHLHWHVVPRWNGDTNFMPVVGQTRVLPELLEETYRKLAPRFQPSGER
ncbi:MAG TPA: HIT domain-containing protein [Actinomycetota bacterium]|nr:HIT domain-containing protein [Actinomycetota bacterium]